MVDHHDLVVCQYEEVTAITRGSDGAETANAMFAIRSRRRDGSERRIAARAVVIATGGFGDPNQLDLSGGASAYPDRIIHYYREPYPFFGQDVVVVGGGNSAVESALELYRNGVRVCMVHFADVFDRGVKPWVRPDIDNRVASGEIPMHWNSRVAAVGAKTVTIVSESTGVRSEAPADWVLAMTGWRPRPHAPQRPGRPVRRQDRHSGSRSVHDGDQQPRGVHRGRDRSRLQRQQDLH